MEHIYAWHFGYWDYTTNQATTDPQWGAPQPLDGARFESLGQPVLCRAWPHASIRAIDALRNRHRLRVGRVLCEGVITHGDDKLACNIRTDLWGAAPNVVRPVLVAWSCDCAEDALTMMRSRGREPDARSWQAIEVTRAYLRGEATIEQVREARKAAYAYAADAAAYAADAYAYAAAYAADAAADAAAAYAAYAYAAADAARREAEDRYSNWLHDRLMALAPAGYGEQ